MHLASQHMIGVCLLLPCLMTLASAGSAGTGEACDADDQCESGSCLGGDFCCSPHATLTNCASCGNNGWCAACVPGAEWVAGVGCSFSDSPNLGPGTACGKDEHCESGLCLGGSCCNKNEVVLNCEACGPPHGWCAKCVPGASWVQEVGCAFPSDDDGGAATESSPASLAQAEAKALQSDAVKSMSRLWQAARAHLRRGGDAALQVRPLGWAAPVPALAAAAASVAALAAVARSVLVGRRSTVAAEQGVQLITAGPGELEGSSE